MLEEHWMIILTIFVTYKSTYLIEVEKVDEDVVKDAFQFNMPIRIKVDIGVEIMVQKAFLSSICS